MKRFKFSLETVHNLRELRRDEAERLLEEAAAQVRAARAIVEQLEQHRAAIETKLARATGPLCADELVLHVNYLELLNQREQQARQQLAAREREHEHRRAATLVAAQEVEVTEQLRVRQQTRHAAEVARVEQVLLDEMALAKTLRERLGKNE